MNNIYDFNEIYEISSRQKKLIIEYVIFVICFLLALVLACIYLDNNILLTVVFAGALLTFILFSIVFWKVKYGILKEYKSFLDMLETGKSDSFVGIFERKFEESDDEEAFEKYVFISSNKKSEFLIHKLHRIDFIEGQKYHIECVGRYICQWEIVE